MKKAISAFLALALCLSLSIPALGAESKTHTFPDGSTVSLTNVLAEETITWDVGNGEAESESPGGSAVAGAHQT